MKAYKRVLALALAGAMALSLGGCSASPDVNWVMEYKGEKLPSGVYLYHMVSAYSEAGTLVENPEKDVLTQKVEDKDAAQWINEKAKGYTLEHLAIEEQYNTLGLAFTEEEKAMITAYTDNQWSYLEEAYTLNGIAKSSLELVIANSLKANAVFESIYGEGGSNPVSEQELKTMYEADYTRSQYIAIAKKDGAGQPLPQEELDKAKAEIDGYLERAQKGENFEDIVLDYEKAHTPEGQPVHEHTAPGLHDSIIPKTGSNFPAKYVEEVFRAEVNTPLTFEDDDYYFLILRKDVMGDGKDFENRKGGLRTQLKGEEFQNQITLWAEGLQGITENAKAFSLYQPKEIKFPKQ